MKTKLFVLLGVVALPFVLWYGVLTSTDSRWVAEQMSHLHTTLQPGMSGVIGYIKINSAKGLPDEVTGQEIDFEYQYPDKLLLGTTIEGKDYRIGRNGNEIWLHAPDKQLAVVGSNDVPRFANHPESLETVALPDFDIPVKRWQLRLLPVLLKNREHGSVEFRSWAQKKFNLPNWQFSCDQKMFGLDSDLKVESEDFSVSVRLEKGSANTSIFGTSGDSFWQIPAPPEKIECVALAHLARFADVALSNLNSKIATLGPATGNRKVIATHGKGRLEDIDGTRVLFLKGTPETMGEQHGTLLRDEVHDLVDRIVYGVGVGSSLDKGRWFFGEIEEAQNRLEPFISERYTREMDAIAAAAGLHPQEVRLSNFFPELFHCSGFALHGSATVDGKMYHGRVLDYLRGLGLEQNATVMIVQPDEGNAWVNLGYAGFVGTVTAMNEKHIAIGEMGGRGEGNWDGTPMAQLMRDVMEQADTIDQAVEMMRRAKRTCEYYYVISDAKDGRAVGIKATPEIFETVWSGESHPQLIDPVKDTVLLSAGSRYEELVKRVKVGFGKFDAESARELMSRPVCMTSNIQSVLFAPDTLDFWVANADSENVASHTRYTKYNLAELLNEKPEPTDAK